MADKKFAFELGKVAIAFTVTGGLGDSIIAKKILSCDGALPIRDDKVNIPLKPECKSEFDKLKLGNYITIYSDIERDAKRPKNKNRCS